MSGVGTHTKDLISLSKESIVAIDQDTIDKWRAQLSLLKPKKRKNWASHLTDKWGQRSKVIYKTEEDKFYNWSLIGKEWTAVMSLEMVRSEAKIDLTIRQAPPTAPT